MLSCGVDPSHTHTHSPTGDAYTTTSLFLALCQNIMIIKQLQYDHTLLKTPIIMLLCVGPTKIHLIYAKFKRKILT